MSFPALEAAQAELKTIFDQAGPDLNLKAVTSVPSDVVGNPDRVLAHVKALNQRIESLQKVHAQMVDGDGESGDASRPVGAGSSPGLKGAQVLHKGQTMGAWLKANPVKDGPSYGDEPLSFGRWLKGVATNQWQGAAAERKAMSEGTLTAGGHLVPTPVAGSVIDLARNASRVFQAGATTVPMTSSTLKVARLTSEGTPGWRAENGAITGADMVFDSVTFTARSLVRLVLLSRELFEDADPATGPVIENSFAAQLALELDRAALRGSGTAPEPRGVLNQSGITTTTHGANGAVIANYDFWLDSAGVVLGSNFEANAHIHAPRSTVSLSKLKEATTNAYMRRPDGLLPMLATKQVPNNLTVGTSADCSEVYTGQWNMLAIGIRTGFEIQFLRERFVDNLQYAFLATLRADVQLFQPAAFVVDTGVRG